MTETNYTSMNTPTYNQQELIDLVECPICREVFDDPRTLPCIHSFCLKCIAKYIKNSQHPSQLACPLCRKKFVLTRSGVMSLPKNTFMSKLCHMQEDQLNSMIKEVDTKCESCGRVMGVVTSSNPAVTAAYCEECQQKLNGTCTSDLNRKFAVSDGNLQTIDDSRPNSVVSVKKSPTQPPVKHRPSTKTNKLMLCEEHAGVPLDVYCGDCGRDICASCRTGKHSKHKCYDIREEIDKFRQQLQSDSDGIVKMSEAHGRLLDQLSNDRQALQERANKIEQAICDSASLLLDEVERNKNKLLGEVTSMAQMRVKQIDGVYDEVEIRLVSIDGLKRYTEELANRGTAGDIARELAVLHDRSDDLNRRETIIKSLKSIGTMTMKFTPTDLTEYESIVGHFECQLRGCKKGVRRWTSSIVHVMPPQGVIGGVTSLGDELFVVRIAVNQIEVYDTNKFNLKRKLTVSNATNLFGITSCVANKCLYIADHYGNKIHKMVPSRNDPGKRWPVASCPVGLAVNRAKNVLVACYGAHKIQEYTTQGVRVRVINLSPSVTHPVHVGQLADGQFVVTYGSWDSTCRVSVVGNDGKVVRNYCNESDGSIRQISGSTSLVVDRKDNIMLCEWASRRVVIVDSSLSETREFALDQVEGGLQEPWSLCLNESRGRLYIGEWGGERVLVFNVATNDK